MEELITFHVIEPGRSDRATLFEVSMIVDPDTKVGLQDRIFDFRRPARRGRTRRHRHG